MVLKGSLTMSEAKVDMRQTLATRFDYYYLGEARYSVKTVEKFLLDFLTDVTHLMSLGIKIQFDFGGGTVICSDCTEVALTH